MKANASRYCIAFVATIAVATAARTPGASDSAVAGADSSMASLMPICARCGETDPPVKHSFNNEGNWYTGGDFHSSEKSGTCATTTESPSHTQGGCDGGGIGCEEDCLAEIAEAASADDVDRLATLLLDHGPVLKFNEERSAIQVVSCAQRVFAHFPVRVSAETLANADVPRR